MTFLLSRFLPWFFLPFGVSLILLLWGIGRRQRVAQWAGIAVLLLSSNSPVSAFLMRSAEGWAERRPIGETPTADAIVVLSGGRLVAPGRERVSEWHDADRFFGGVSLFVADKAPLLVFTGARQASRLDVPSEGSILAEQARAFGIPADRVAVTGEVWNTDDEAREVSRLLRDRGHSTPHVLLVTSAFHMSRARRVFEQQGLVVEPFPVDFSLSQGHRFSLIDLVPSIGALARTQASIHEFYGRAFYWAVGPR